MKRLHHFGRLILIPLCILGSVNIAGSVDDLSNEAIDEVKNLVVMITCQPTGKDKTGLPIFGAGIIFGAANNHLYIMTADHVVRSCRKNTQKVELQLNMLSGKPVTATLLNDFDTALDLAVLDIADPKTLGIDVKMLPFDRLGDTASLKRGDWVYSMGFPGGRPWGMNVTPDRISSSREGRLYFESNFIALGHSGGALLNEGLELIGMIQSDQPPNGEAIDIAKVVTRLSQWKYPVDLGKPLEPLIFTSVTSGEDHFCGLTKAGLAYCGGANDWGQLGRGAMTKDQRGRRVIGGLRFRSLSAGGDYTCGITISNTAYCWGNNIWGALGNGSNEGSNVPIAVSGGLLFKSVSAGTFQTCAVTITGVGYCWGSQDRRVRAPAAIPGGLSFKSLTSGSVPCGVSVSGAAYCWGYNGRGQLGNGTDERSAVPVAVSGGLNFASLSLQSAKDATFTCGVTITGAAYCWGSNYHGELGNGQGGERTTGSKNSAVPVVVSGGITFKVVSTGLYHACGVHPTGKAYCWGSNDQGQLGNNTKKASNVPVPVSGNLKFHSISCGSNFTCGVTTDGPVYCWGELHEQEINAPVRFLSP